MLKPFLSIQKNFKYTPKSYCIDNWVFRLHYRFTFYMLLVCIILVTSRQYIGEHIRCIGDKGVVEKVLNTFCYVTSTFTVVKHLNSRSLILGLISHAGIGPHNRSIPRDEIIVHNYYQWVPYFLFGQACIFLLTHILWKTLEGGRLKILSDNLRFAAFAVTNKEVQVGCTKIYSKKQRNEHINTLRTNFIQRKLINRYWHRGLMLCEVLNVLNVVLQFYITDLFLNGKFLSLGKRVVVEGLNESVDVMDEIFPKVTKCTFHKYGPSGSIQNHEALCILALNVINEKIFTFLWVYFVVLLILSSLVIAWRIMTMCLHATSGKFNQLVFSSSCAGKLNPYSLRTVSKHCNYSDWLFLRYLAKNLDGKVFREIFLGLAEDLESTHKKFDDK